jgi:hypothetical protein
MRKSMSQCRHATCPKCNSVATASDGHKLLHGAGHSLQHGIKHHNPLLVGLGIVLAGVQMAKNQWFRCEKCGHGFFSR